MLVDPRIARLRADDGMQQVMRQAATRAVRWCRSDEAVRGVLAALDRYAEGDDLANCPALADALAEVEGMPSSAVRSLRLAWSVDARPAIVFSIFCTIILVICRC